jgi:putative transposase
LPEYRRASIPGSRYFFTVVTYNREPLLTSSWARDCLDDAIRVVQGKIPFEVEAFVLLPDHLHSIWRLPENDSDFSTRWNCIKGRFSRIYSTKVDTGDPASSSRLKKREQSIWQRRFWEHWIRDEHDFARHLDYIHFNPVKHGYVHSPKEWDWSTFHRYVEKQWYDLDWGVCEPTDLLDSCVGE